MERRHFLAGSALVAAGLSALSNSAFASETTKTSASALLIRNAEALKLLGEFGRMATMCQFDGEKCLEHCQEQLANGSTEFVYCSVATSQMSTICAAVAK